MLVCKKCVLGKPDASGRPASVETEELVSIPCSLLVSAIGEKVVAKDFADNGIALTERGKVAVNADTLETTCRTSSSSETQTAAPQPSWRRLRTRAGSPTRSWANTRHRPRRGEGLPGNCLAKQGSLAVYDSAGKETERCLACYTICECCVQSARTARTSPST
jgi:putative selenate reductase